MDKLLIFAAAKLKAFAILVFEFVSFWFFYGKKKTISFSISFEKNKNAFIRLLITKRGRYNRPFLHITALTVLIIGVVIAPFLADTYPVFSNPVSLSLQKASAQDKKQSIVVGDNLFQTDVSQKPRDSIITYTVEGGDTLSTVARKFGISVNTIKWANDLTSDDLSVGQELKILPVTGIAHKVAKGETVYSIAKIYNTEPQKIVDFPFNDFANPETFSLVEGQILIVPDGIKPSEQRYIKPGVYAVLGPVPVVAGGFTWPVRGLITQFFTWYHSGLDIAAPFGTPIMAAQSGTVTEVRVGSYDTGYGNNVWISNGEGLESHYAHMKSVNVSVGQSVIGGQTVIGWIGLTGRTTGPHVHFEIRRNGVLVNPLPYLQ